MKSFINGLLLAAARGRFRLQADFNAFLRHEVETAARIVKAADLKPQ